MAPENQDHTVVVHVTPGELLDGRWRIESRVGQGAMGSVFRGRDMKANRLIAIKILAPEHCRKQKVLARFEREAETMTQLRHPNIVQLYGHGRRGALPYIVMEFLEGLTLGEVLEKRGAFELPETVAVVKQVALGLAFLHHHGLVHRDIKPHNIVVDATGKVTILDLGVVRDQANPGLTRPGAMVGTPYYMSPEQIYGVDDIDRRTDIYALAAMTFELLTARPPFLGNNNFEVLYGHKNLPPPDASSVVSGLPKGVSQALMRAMAKRREDRPQSATEFAADLEATVGPRKVDLEGFFAPFMPKPAPAKSPVTKQPTRLVRRLPDTDERHVVGDSNADLPMASDDDVQSVAASPIPKDFDIMDFEVKTQLFRVEDDEVLKRALSRGASPASSSRRTQAVKPENVKPEDLLGPMTPGAAEKTRLVAPMPNVPLDAPTNAAELIIAVVGRGKPVKATVFIDGVKHGPAPVTALVGSGPHQVRVEAAGFKPLEKSVDAFSGRSTPYTLTLR